MRFRPLTDSKSVKFFIQCCKNKLEFRTENICVFSHMLMQSVDIFEEANVTELVQLVVSDSLYSHIFAEVIQVRFGCSNCCDTGTREAYLGGRSKFINNIRIACFRTLIKDLKKEILIVIIEMMNAVSVIPVNTEVRCCWFQMCKNA